MSDIEREKSVRLSRRLVSASLGCIDCRFSDKKALRANETCCTFSGIPEIDDNKCYSKEISR